MGIFKGTVGITRFSIRGELPPDAADFLDRRIKRFRFQDIDQTTDELSVGWVSAHDFMDASFSYSGYSLEPYVILGMRVDQRKVPGAMLKKYHRLELRKAKAASDGEQLSRTRREELKEKARVQLLARMPPSSRVYDVCWDASRGEVWLGATAKGAIELFEDLFRKTFELGVMPVIPWHIAQRRVTDLHQRARLDEARPFTLASKE